MYVAQRGAATVERLALASKTVEAYGGRAAIFGRLAFEAIEQLQSDASMKLSWAISEGKLTGLGTLALGALGASLIAYTLLLSEHFWLGSLAFILGFGCLGFAGAANNAASLGLRPFGEAFYSWRAAKSTYQSDSETMDASVSGEPLEGQGLPANQSDNAEGAACLGSDSSFPNP